MKSFLLRRSRVSLTCAASLIVLTACGGGGAPAVDGHGSQAAAVSQPLTDMADSSTVAALAVAGGAVVSTPPTPTAAPAPTPEQAPADSTDTVAPAEPIVVAESIAVPVSLPGSTEAPKAAVTPGLILNTTALPTENWAGAQSKVAGTPSWASWIGSRKSTIDSWTAKTRERADLVGGWMHDYVDASTGVPLTWTPDSPEPPNGSTDQQIKFKRAWVFYVRENNIRRVADAVRVFKITGETKYRDWAAAQLDFYAANYNLWPLRTNNGLGRMYQNGLDEATSSFALLEAARLLAPSVTTARAEQWRVGLFYPMAGNLKSISAPLSNIGLWHGAAVASIGMRYRDAALISWGLDGSIGVRATLAASLTSDNLWNEGSFSYNSYVISALYSLTTQASLEGYAAQVAGEKNTIAKLLLSPLDFRFDNGSLPTPSDAAPLTAIDVNAHMAVYRAVPTWWGVQKAVNYQSWDTLIDPPPALTAQPVLPAVSTRDFPAVRMAVLRAGAWQAFVHYGQVTINHAQQEALTFELFKGTVPVSTDSGTVSYGSPYHTEYFTQGAANNVPLINGSGQSAWSAGTVNQFSAQDSRIVVTHAGYQPAVSVSRDLRVTTLGLTESTTLQASDGTTRRLGVAFHSACTVTPLSGLTTSTTGAQPPANKTTAYWTGMVAYKAQSLWSVRLTCGSDSFTYAVSGPTAQTVFIGKGPTTPLPATRAVLYYETSGTTATYTSTIKAP